MSGSTSGETALVSVLLDFETVATLLGRPANGTTRTWIARNKGFPSGRQASPNRVFWVRAEVEAWIASLPPVIRSRAEAQPPATAIPPAYKKADATKQPEQNRHDRDTERPAVVVERLPACCPECGSSVAADAAGTIRCNDSDQLGCSFSARIGVSRDAR